MNETPNTQQSLVADDESVAAAPRAGGLVKPPKKGLLVTNHQNLMYMLAAGLLMPPSEFGRKYYHDTLAAFPGWLPFFVGQGRRVAQAPRAAIDGATAEAAHLRGTLLEIDLRGLRGSVHAFGEGGWARRRLEEGIGRGDWLVLVPAPLPVNRIERALFRSVSERKDFKTAASERSNVPQEGIGLQTVEKRFEGVQDRPWPPPGGPDERDVAVPAAQAAGGVLAVLHQVANTGELSVKACRAAFDPSSEPPDDTILAALPGWMQKAGSEAGGSLGAGAGRQSATPSSPNTLARGLTDRPGTGRDLYWGAVQQLVEHRREPDGRSPEDVLISFLRESSERMGAEVQVRAADFVSTLEALGGGLGGGTVSEMFDQHQTPLARAAILFLLRQKTRELLELVEDHPQLEERDRLAAAILFGVRDGWLGLPMELRGTADFGRGVTHRMAALAHRIDATGFDLGRAPERVVPLRELFSGSKPWGDRENLAAATLARQSKWPCIRSRVTLRRGEYRMRIERGAMRIDFDGEPPVETWVERSELLDRLAGERVAPFIEAKVRAILGR